MSIDDEDGSPFDVAMVRLPEHVRDNTRRYNLADIPASDQARFVGECDACGAVVTQFSDYVLVALKSSAPYPSYFDTLPFERYDLI